MNCIIRYYGQLSELAGTNEEEWSFNKQTTIGELYKILSKKYSGFNSNEIVFFQDNKKCSYATLIVDRSEIDCMPPFSGG